MDTIPHAHAVNHLASGSRTWDTLHKDDAVEVAGDLEVLARFLACFDLTRRRAFTSRPR